MFARRPARAPPPGHSCRGRNRCCGRNSAVVMPVVVAVATVVAAGIFVRLWKTGRDSCCGRDCCCGRNHCCGRNRCSLDSCCGRNCSCGRNCCCDRNRCCVQSHATLARTAHAHTHMPHIPPANRAVGRPARSESAGPARPPADDYILPEHESTRDSDSVPTRAERFTTLLAIGRAGSITWHTAAG